MHINMLEERRHRRSNISTHLTFLLGILISCASAPYISVMAAHLMNVTNDLSELSVIPIEPPPSSHIPYISIDIIQSEILPKLPPKSLMRFKTVCKSFNATISSPEFSRLHHHHFLSPNSRLLVTNGTKHTIDIYDLNSNSSAPYTTFRWYDFSTSLVGSCNGVVLIQINRNIQRVLPLILLNPSTRSFIEFRSTDINGVEGNVGLGFDKQNDDYKIVVVSGMSSKYYRYSEYERVTRVYSINSKSWKVVDETLVSECMEKPYTGYNGVLVNNHLLHWLTVKQSDPKHKISCFDVVGETWLQNVLFPDCYYDPKSKSKFLDFGDLDGCLFSSFGNKSKSCLDVWVLKEYGVHESWIKLLSINTNGRVPIGKFFDESLISYSCRGIGPILDMPGGVIPVTCRGIGLREVLLKKRYDAYSLFWYNWKNNTIVEPEIPNVYGHQTYFVKETLVMIPDAKLFGDLYETS